MKIGNRLRALVTVAGGLLAVAALPSFAQTPAEEQGNAYGQLTYIYQQKRPFSAAYTDLNGSPNSLSPEKERSFTTSATAFLGWRAWRGGELYFVPELISELPLSGLHGLGGSIQNGELEKNGTVKPTIYRARLFFRQSWSLGGRRPPWSPGRCSSPARPTAADSS